MALLIFGKTVCPLCDRVIKSGESTHSFPAFVVNEKDPCFIFSDCAFHEECVRQHKLGAYATQRVEGWVSKVGPGKRKCVVCQNEVTNPDDYLLVEHLSDDANDPLRAFNYTHLHKSCLPKWKSRDYFVGLVNKVIASGRWQGGYLAHLLNEIGQ